ncbi:MAG: PMT family glycosyltransferase 4-amino-4-deoxy-L-arabinose transferase [Candidatus Saganbacteria bacterium]|uniref:PMT family glycosyltransferase 4-amino-4-deoxy-L-arabinose transferase n=1 Tax=Candidatus Saganbacteria bacterium TaxID=2575572 RepID=A0A833NWP7_UNCSA|nr:MAG: PMT family glycosyltransferase 4-amino-4-deoxy-L-arabinose transferase [Candidatus Saganbacteria bacterium]
MNKLSAGLVFVVLLSAVLYFFQLGAPTLWDQDEGQVLASSLEMVKSGEYLTPHLNGGIYFHKPPLYAWLTAVLFKVFGFSEFIGRFWTAVFGVAGIALVYYFARAVFNERAAFLSALMLAVSPLYFVLSKMALVDIFLTFFIMLSMYLFYLGYKNPGQKKYFFLMYLSMALGTLAKGPLGLLIPALSIALFLIIEKKAGFIKEMVPLKGLLFFILIASPWFIVEAFREGLYFLQMLFGQFLFSIYFTPFQQHPGPIYYYILVALVGFLPWSSIFILSLFKKPPPLLLSVFLVTLLVFSLASTKVPGYFLPAFPFMAMIAGGYLDKIFNGEDKIGFYFCLTFSLLVLVVTFFLVSNAVIPAEFSQALVYLQTIILLAASGFFLAFLFSFIKPNPSWSIGAWVFSLIILYVGFMVWLVPYAENFKYSKDLAFAAKEKEHIAFFRTWLPPSFVFYLNRQQYPTFSTEINDVNKLRSFLSKSNSACLIPENEEKTISFPHRVISKKGGFTIIDTL